MCAVLAALCGYLVSGFSGGAALNMGEEYLLASIAVVVIGGTSVAGGYANVPGLWGAALSCSCSSPCSTPTASAPASAMLAPASIIIAVIVAASGQKRPG